MLYAFKSNITGKTMYTNRLYAVELIKHHKEYFAFVGVEKAIQDKRLYDVMIIEQDLQYSRVFDTYYRYHHTIENCTVKQVKAVLSIRHKYYKVHVKECTACGLE